MCPLLLLVGKKKENKLVAEHDRQYFYEYVRYTWLHPSTRSSLDGVWWWVNIFLISAMAQAGFKCFGQALVQFMIVWHLNTE